MDYILPLRDKTIDFIIDQYRYITSLKKHDILRYCMLFLGCFGASKFLKYAILKPLFDQIKCIIKHF